MDAIRTHLLLIDPQNDFCDLPESYLPATAGAGASERPALPVQGAHADMLRVAELIERAGSAISEVTVTLDSHQHLDIGHPAFWQQADGGSVAPFTTVSAQDVEQGRFLPRLPELRQRVLAYLKQLAATQRYQHMIWPFHCEIGSFGHNVHPDVRRAYSHWEERAQRSVIKVLKGTNPLTEHYSALQAEVVDPEDAGTQLNRELLARLARAERIYIAGEASSHCVKATTEHLVQHLEPALIERLALLSDCMSPVTGFEAQAAEFLRAMRAAGVRVVSSAEALQELTQPTRARS